METKQYSGSKQRHSTFAILFYINRTKVRKDGLCQLLCKVSIDTESEQIGTKVLVDPAVWSSEGRAVGRSRNALDVNRAIDNLTKQIKGHYKQIKDNLGYVTAELVKNAMKGIAQNPLTLIALFEEHNAEFQKRVGVDRTQETYQIYVRSCNCLREFVQQKLGAEDVSLRSLDREFYDAYDLFLRADCGLKQKMVQLNMFHQNPNSEQLRRLQTAVDEVNGPLNLDSCLLVLGAELTGQNNTRLRREMLSKRPTTKWNDRIDIAI